MKRVFLFVSALSLGANFSSAHAADECAVLASRPTIRREGVLFSNIVVIGGASASCPESAPGGTIALTVCLNAPYIGENVEAGSACNVLEDDDGTTDGFAKAKCFALNPYVTIGTAAGVKGTTTSSGEATSQARTWSESDCPPVPPEPDLPPLPVG